MSDTSENATEPDGSYSAQVDGEVGNVRVTIRVESEDEHLADIVLSDLEGKADVLNQIVELERHPDAARPPSRVDWEGWLHGDYEEVRR